MSQYNLRNEGMIVEDEVDDTDGDKRSELEIETTEEVTGQPSSVHLQECKPRLWNCF